MSSAAKAITSCRRRRLFVGDVPQPARPAGLDQPNRDGGDVVDMDAVEDLARLDDPPRFAARSFSSALRPGP